MAKYNVLIIDDAFFIRNLIKKAIAKKPMTKDNTFEVVGEAQDGRAGIDLCETLKPDIITVDFNIPTINGLDFAKYLKELHPEIPVIMISSNLDPDFKQKVQEAKCRLLTKPFQEAYLWKVLDESVEEILTTDVTVQKPKINAEAQKILDELAEEMKGEIVPLKDTSKDISSKELANKNIGVAKAKNVGFDYSGTVLEIKTEKRRMSSELLENPNKTIEPIAPAAPVVPDIPFSQVDNDVDLEDEDDFIIDLDAVENQRESEYGKTGIEELEDEEFLFIEDEDESSNNKTVEETKPAATLMLDFAKTDDISIVDDDDDIFIVDENDDESTSDNVTQSSVLSEQNYAYQQLLNSVTFNYYDYLGRLLYSVQNTQEKKDISINVTKSESQVSTPVSVDTHKVREETKDEEFDRLFNEFNGGGDVHFDNPNNNVGNEQTHNNSQNSPYATPQQQYYPQQPYNTNSAQMPNYYNETVLSRDREHISIDPPKDDTVFRVYGSKLANVTSSETFSQFTPPPSVEAPIQKKGFFARLLDKIFGRT